jgi:hypothetical protein
MGLGIVVEYAGKKGDFVWNAPASTDWDYTQFADAAARHCSMAFETNC